LAIRQRSIDNGFDVKSLAPLPAWSTQSFAVPRQHNFNDCGVFALLFARAILASHSTALRASLNIVVDDVSAHRVALATELLETITGLVTPPHTPTHEPRRQLDLTTSPSTPPSPTPPTPPSTPLSPSTPRRTSTPSSQNTIISTLDTTHRVPPIALIFDTPVRAAPTPRRSARRSAPTPAPTSSSSTTTTTTTTTHHPRTIKTMFETAASGDGAGEMISLNAVGFVGIVNRNRVFRANGWTYGGVSMIFLIFSFLSNSSFAHFSSIDRCSMLASLQALCCARRLQVRRTPTSPDARLFATTLESICGATRSKVAVKFDRFFEWISTSLDTLGDDMHQDAADFLTTVM
jgi:hypothetical protein